MNTEIPKDLQPVHSKRSILSWCFYDWANTAFGTVIITFVFSVFFSRGIVQDETEGAALWSTAIGISGLFIAVFAPIFGSVADHAGDRKRWVFWLSLVCIVPCALLWFAQPVPDQGNILLVLVLVVIANIGFELAQVFYNSMLPHIAPHHMMGRISGWAWGLGYGGGLLALVITLFGLVGVGDTEPFFGVTGADSMNIRASGPLIALWFAVFMIPLFIWTKDVERQPMGFLTALKAGTKQLLQSVREIKTHKNIALYLLASAVYRDGLVTLFAIGGVYAAGQFGMDFQEILIFAIGLNVTAGIGAFLFAYVDDWIGSRHTAMISLIGLVMTGLIILSTDEKSLFMGLALFLGIFIGPAQAASRTLAGRLAPPGMVTQTYGLYAFTGKSVTFMGPIAYGWATSAFGTQQAGMMTIVLFWLVGLALLSFVKEER